MKLIKDFNLTITYSRTFHRNKTKWKMKKRKIILKRTRKWWGKCLMAQRLKILALERPQRARDDHLT